MNALKLIKRQLALVFACFLALFFSVNAVDETLSKVRATFTLSLNSASVVAPGTFVAVWVGANSPHNVDWVQGGIEFSYGEAQPFIYFEVGHKGLQTQLQKIPTMFGKTSTFKLLSIGAYWQVVINGRMIPDRILVENPSIQIVVEKVGVKSRITASILRGQVQ